MSVEELKQTVLEALDDLKASDIDVLEVRGKTLIADYMIVCSGRSTRQIKSIAEHVVEKAKAHGYRPKHIEGTESSGWILVDLSDIIVHVMTSETREFYQIEKLWR
jgi:ribosome-associated protein